MAKKVKYAKVKGAHVKGDVQSIGQVIEKLKRANGGEVLPKELVDQARDPKNPCHCNFTWSDSKAAEERRLDQARYLLRSVVVVHVKHEVVTTRPTVVCVRYGGQTTEPYQDFISVMKDPQQRALYLNVAKQELQAFAKKYEQLTELAKVIAAIKEVCKKK